MNKRILFWAAFNMAIAVVLGAFTSHIIKKIAPQDVWQSFQVGVSYHIYHSLGLLFIGLVNHHIKSKSIILSAKLMEWGIICFSFSIYILNVFKILFANQEMSGPFKVLFVITPIGGVLFIAAWMILALAIWKHYKEE